MLPVRRQITVERTALRASHSVRKIYPLLWIGTLIAIGVAGAGGAIARSAAVTFIGSGTLLIVGLWAFRIRRTLPLAAILASQDFLWYATPLIFGNRDLDTYQERDILNTISCLGIYFLALTASWWIVVSRRSRLPASTLVLDMSSRPRQRKTIEWTLLGLGICFVVELGLLLGWFNWILYRLPNGVMNPINTVLSAVECGATLLLFFECSRGGLSYLNASLSVILWSGIVLVRIASILLSSCMAMVSALLLGCYLGSGKIGWRTLISIGLILAFFNLSKFEMRQKYWNSKGGGSPLTLMTLPGYLAEWGSHSIEMIFGEREDLPGLEISRNQRSKKGQSLLERVSNFQMLLYVNDRIQNKRDPLLWGKTYEVVLIAIVPRILWPEKPRAHIGQEILNVHFHRQTRQETFTTYIAWGLLPESVGNFGEHLGPLILGIFLGGSLGWIESRTSPLPLFSLPSICAGFLALFITASSSMVASVLFSSLSQMMLVLVVGLTPFTRRIQL